MNPSWNRRLASISLALLAGVAAPPAQAQPKAECAKMPKACAASVQLVQAQERFRKAYMLETGSCAKIGACSTGVRPNVIGGRPDLMNMQLKGAVQSCEAYCDEQNQNDDAKRKECRAGCDGTRVIVR